MRWFQALMPKEERFFDLFDSHARTLSQGAHALRRLLDGGDKVPEWCQAIAQHEHEADLIAREVMLAVRRTFITPFDRSDIRGLISSMDDAVDQMHKTAKAITLYEVREFEDPMRTLGDIIVKTADITAESTPLLRQMGPNAARLNVLTEEVGRLEEESDHLYDAGMQALFKGSRADPMAFIVGAEIYDHLEKVVDRFEDVANRISGVLIEHL
ncbi:DUF47 domain-containing protein [Phenylobacterium sp.]|jgi:hypothetical protein|uniref:DUF47 domain-containing protein n=1 Tax=Phenylobacterium sp. TaxID=1871053 RepID=UPI002E2F8A14|nr:DUF47 domain-containing protein [Phenylobacterium sp.]HEX2561225.1 DUF47 domain-containing protein [Phenylobacterium sp.]